MSDLSTSIVDTDSEQNSDNNFEEITNSEEISLEQDNASNINDFDNNLPETVSLIRVEDGSKIYLVGTAHFSIESQNDVARVIQAVQPHVVMVELCSSRINILQLDEKTLLEEAKNINMEKIRNTIKQNGLFNGLMYILLLNMSAHLTKELGMAPGGEFRTAFSEARKVNNCEIHLGDRPIQITIQRALARLSWFQTLKLCWHLLTSKDPISKEDVEKCKKRDMLEELLAEMAGEFPALGEVFVNERDIYLTHSLQIATYSNRSGQTSKNVVGVVGIGHVPGILKLWPKQQAQYISDIVTVPPPTVCSKVVRVCFKLSILSFGGYLIYRYVPVTRQIPYYCYSLFNRQ